MSNENKVGTLEKILNDAVDKWNTFNDITKSCLATVIYTWIVFAVLSIVSITHSWIFVPVLCTVSFGYFLTINADKW